MTALLAARSRSRIGLDYLILPAIASAPLLLNLLLLTEPLDRDEGAYATVALGLLDGRLPYRDLFDHKPPLIYVWYALSFAIFGESDWSPRLLAGLCLGATAILVESSARVLYGHAAGRVAGVAFAGMTGIALLEPAANVEPFMLLPMVGSLRAALAWRQSGAIGWLALAGLLASLAFLTKEVTVWNGAVPLVYILALPGSRRQRLASLAAGAALPVALIVAMYGWMDALDDLLYANVEYNLLYAADVTHAEKAALAWKATLVVGLAAAPFAAATLAGAVCCLKRRDQSDWLVLAWLAASALGVASTGRFFPHYFLQMMPASALVLAALSTAWPKWGGAVHRRRLSVAAFGACSVVALALSAPAYLGGSALERQRAKGDTPAVAASFENRQIGAYLRTRTNPNDTVWQAGRESGVYFYAGRLPATAVFYDRPFWLDDQTLDDTLASLRESPPRYIVDGIATIDDIDLESDVVRRVRDFIDRHYDFETRIGYADIYKLRGE